MFGTIIIDAYKKDEKDIIAEALDELCSPMDNYGWASAGVYCYWNYYTKQVYYIGLAVDLCERFKQHNGLIAIDDNSCKKKQIDDYFKSHEKLGFSIFVQSPLSQPITSKNKKKYEGFFDKWSPIENYIGNEGKEHIKRVEGVLIEAYRKIHSSFPIWNKVGGSIEGQKASKKESYEIINLFKEFNPNPIVSRSSLRELADNPTLERYENFLHSVRMTVFHSGLSYEKSLEYHKSMSIIDTYGEMLKVGYFEKELKI
ncbi:hypothetical protein [Tepidibacter sp. Z1-5]|uniref:hypothetical protein n=1 Tax=Tepidibacter sp. Z1-5 TaxID=3134138 RepID=UPI0030BFCABA